MARLIERPVKYLPGTLLAIGAAGALAFCAWLALGADPALDSTFNDWVYNGVVAFAALACLATALRTAALRGAWLALGVGLLAWAAGDVYWAVALEDLRRIPYPSWADAGYLLAIPCFFTAIALSIRARAGRFTLASWLDGAVGALAAATLATALLAPALVGLTKGHTDAVMTNLAYPIGDVLLVAMITGALVITGLRGARGLVLVGAGLLFWAAGDIIYLYQEATSSYTGGWLDTLWLAGALLMASGACVSTAPTRRTGPAYYRSSLLLPAAFTLLAAGILVWDHFAPVTEASVWLGAATIAAVVLRLAVSFRENDRLVSALHGDSVTDALTGLGNRRQLLDDLDAVFSRRGEDRDAPYAFALFDLDGFKSYNDSFGHPAGDALLRRLGQNLARGVESNGSAYRLGGDEFCVLVPADGRRANSVLEMVRAALTEEGEGFSIGASGGGLLVPDEAEDAGDALRQADKRMYYEKSQSGSRADAQTREVLLRMLRAREPALSHHLEGVARLAVRVGREFGFDGEEMDVLGRAAELHDIGKIAIPDEVLKKPDPLDDAEWELMRRHTLIGERILDAAPAMAPVARLVRSSHERWDGGGYPDGLEGELVPLGSRIILVCDAYDAMTSERPYQHAIPPREALAELRANAGSQFDPRVVDVFCALLEEDLRRDPASGRRAPLEHAWSR